MALSWYMHALNECGVKPSKNYALNKKYALNNEQRLTTSFYGMLKIWEWPWDKANLGGFYTILCS